MVKNSELFKKIIHILEKEYSASDIDNLKRFVKGFYDETPFENLTTVDAHELLEYALSGWRCFEKRQKSKNKVEFLRHEKADDEGTTITNVISDEITFNVESIKTVFHYYDIGIDFHVHPVFHAKRDGNGKLIELIPTEESVAKNAESLIQIHTKLLSEQEIAKIKNAIEKGLDDTQSAVEDWIAMRNKVDHIAEEFQDHTKSIDLHQAQEAVEFLQWLKEENFTFLGYRSFSFLEHNKEQTIGIDKNSGSGILKDENIQVFENLRKAGKIPDHILQFLKMPNIILINKADMLSTVRHKLPLDTVSIKRFNKNGKVIGEHLFVGLFSPKIYMNPARQIPILRHKIKEVLEKSQCSPGGYKHKALKRILDNIQRDELFQISPDDLHKLATGILYLEEKPRVALFVRRDPFDRFMSCLFFCPPEIFNTDLRKNVERVLEKHFNGVSASFTTHFSESQLASVYISIKTKPGKIPKYSVKKIEKELREMSRSWTDLLEERLKESFGNKVGKPLFKTYKTAFPTAYQESFSIDKCIEHISLIEEIMESQKTRIILEKSEEKDHYNLILLGLGTPPTLSKILSTFENMGISVLSEVPHRITPSNNESLWISDFNITFRNEEKIRISEYQSLIEDSLNWIWSDQGINDEFNSLIIASKITWKEARILRAYYKYLRQLRTNFSQKAIEIALCSYPKITRLLITLFDEKFNPAHDEATRSKAKKTSEKIIKEINKITNINHDKIFSRFLNLLQATVRTNAYQEKDYFSFKFDCEKIDHMPLPKPMFEIFVYASDMEGIHLRGGKVARGGLRWSDRIEDFRTEILGLVKAQFVKNAVIVPTGSKGGFVIKRQERDLGREAFLEKGIASYKRFISGLLDITDNLDANDNVIHPPKVVCHDDKDPYLVVAADKGTATFSDIANEIADQYNFWLGDAFASGGSLGYDHKKMGITAKGAWECVKKRFREININTQTDEFTAIGVGDMAGDVFGNGMLLSKHTKMVAAFNHMHIFIDPNPDCLKSYKERKRLFDLPRSTWMDFNDKAISKGGGIFDRSSKVIKLSKEMQTLLNTDVKQLSPDDLIQKILKLNVDLLWFGGIGTFIKSSKETHADVGDKNNDHVRINATDLNCKIIGEGANLGITQRGRIEFANKNGRVNADFIDNCGGVSCSDHEVNIKIFMNKLVRTKAISEKKRNATLVEMTEDVSELVLQDSYDQSNAMSLATAQAYDSFESNVDLMQSLEKTGLLNREVEFLPNEEELAKRIKNNKVFTGPELAVLMAYSKISIYDILRQSDFSDQKYLQKVLVDYFPTQLRKKYKNDILNHPLKKEIISTVIANDMVNKLSLSFFNNTMKQFRCDIPQLAKAYIVAKNVLKADELWKEIVSLDNLVNDDIQAEALLKLRHIIERATMWFVSKEGSIEELVDFFEPKLDILLKNLSSYIPQPIEDEIRIYSQYLTEQDLPEKLALKIAWLSSLRGFGEIILTANKHKCSPVVAAKVYFDLGSGLGISWIAKEIEKIPTETIWQKQALESLLRTFRMHQSFIASRILSETKDKCLNNWFEERLEEKEHFIETIEKFKKAKQIDLAMVAVASEQLKVLANS